MGHYLRRSLASTHKVETLQVNPEASFERVASVLEKVRKIEFVSIGISHPVAYTAYCKFHLIGLPASTPFDSHIQLIAATRLKVGDVEFGISCSGTTRETVQCMVAKEKDATTICLTNAMKPHHIHQRALSLRDTERNQIFPGSASFTHHAAGYDRHLIVSLALKHRTGQRGICRSRGKNYSSGAFLDSRNEHSYPTIDSPW